MNTGIRNRVVILILAITAIVATSTHLKSDTGTCGGSSITLPFTDVPSGNIFFCAIAEAFFSGLTNGTGATTYSPSQGVPREQMAAFITRTMDQSVKRSSKRAALRQLWTIQTPENLALSSVDTGPRLVESDGLDLWVANQGSSTVSRVRASDGHLIDFWTGATNAFGVLVAMGKVFVTGQTDPGKLYQIDPAQAAGSVTVLSSSLGKNPLGITFDGQRIWTANIGSGAGTGSVSIVIPSPLNVVNVSTGFSNPAGIIFNGSNVWVTDSGDGQVKKLDSSGNVLRSVPVGSVPLYPAFDGTNLWVPNHNSNTVSVVRTAGSFAGTVLTTLTGNGMNGVQQAAFDGERMLVTSNDGNSVSLWKASDLTPIGNFSTGAPGFGAFGACSDGLNFWITLFNTGKLARF
jgi:DNA-binding beta-propeller fold protein YncE